MSNARYTVKQVNPENFAWGFREGDQVIDLQSASLPSDAPANALMVESVKTGMVGFFTPEQLTAI